AHRAARSRHRRPHRPAPARGRCEAAQPGSRHIERVVKDSQNVLPTDWMCRETVAGSFGRRSRRGGGACRRTFRSLLADLGTLTKNTVRVPNSSATFDKIANPLRFRREPATAQPAGRVVASRCITGSSSAQLAVAQELRLDQWAAARELSYSSPAEPK